MFELINKAFVSLPEPAQLAVSDFLVKTGLFAHVPLFRMQVRTLEYLGAKKAEIRQALSKAKDLGPSFTNSWKALGVSLFSQAESLNVQEPASDVASLYFRSAMYTLVGNWVCSSIEDRKANYDIALKAFDRYRSYQTPRVEKLTFPFSVGTLAGYLRVPDDFRLAPFPLVIIFQGTDTSKEWMARIEEAATREGLAALSIDQPGFGESGLTGNRMRGADDVSECVEAIFCQLSRRSDLNLNQTGAFGFSFGGFMGVYAAGLDSRIRAAAGIGVPYELDRAFRVLPAIIRKRVFEWADVADSVGVSRRVEGFDVPRVFSQVHCPVRLIHGLEDVIVSPQSVDAIRNVVPGPCETRMVLDGDHTCSKYLATDIVPETFRWLKTKLGRIS